MNTTVQRQLAHCFAFFFGFVFDSCSRHKSMSCNRHKRMRNKWKKKFFPSLRLFGSVGDFFVCEGEGGGEERWKKKSCTIELLLINNKTTTTPSRRKNTTPAETIKYFLCSGTTKKTNNIVNGNCD